jgi:hypothetical protein
MKKVLAVLASMAMVFAMMPAFMLTEVRADDSAATGDFTVTGGQYGVDYKFENSTLTILTKTPVTVSGTTTA